MKAIVVRDSQLHWQDVPDPVTGPGDVMIRVEATAVNRADLIQAAGLYPPPPGASDILGLECAGEVVDIGPDVAGFSVGDQVCALLAGGGYAEFVAAPASQVLPVPAGMTTTEAAAIPEVFATAYLNLFREAALQPGELALLHAGASGVGTAGIQLCRAFDNPVFVTAGATEKLARCVQLGAAGGHNRHDGSFVDSVLDFSAGRGVDVILDPVGAGYLADNLASLAVDGRLVIIGLMGGNKAELPIGDLMVKRQRVIGSTLRARSVDDKGSIMDALHERVWPLFERGELSTVIETQLPVAQAGRAHQLVSDDGTVGKVVLTVQGSSI